MFLKLSVLHDIVLKNTLFSRFSLVNASIFCLSYKTSNTFDYSPNRILGPDLESCLQYIELLLSCSNTPESNG